MKNIFAAAVVLTISIAYLTSSHDVENQFKRRKKPTNLMAGKAMSDWYHQRTFPGKRINMSNISDGFSLAKVNNSRTVSFPGTWTAIGPKNFGGRTLAIGFNPQNPLTLYAGSASGGLWRSYSGGLGATAWHQVETGFPVLGVSAIAVNPNDTNEIFIGTGEVYNDLNTGTGFAVRTTRGTYGLGILKTSDGGNTWSKSIDWAYDELKGVQDILMNPENPSTIFAATTEGTYRTFDSGQNWSLVHSGRMATDLLILPGDTSVVMVAVGNSFSANPGIYRSVDGGSTFVEVINGLPASYSGKAMLDACAGAPNVIFASIAEQLSGLGLYRSGDGGINWSIINPTDYQTYQGWYSHDVIVHPADENIVLTSGIDTWKSYDGGFTLNQKTYWYNWDFNATTVGGPEGPSDYVHADIHRMYYHPADTNLIYLATDGGVFRSADGGETFEGCNGGYQTQQFYANFSCSVTDSLFGIGGMQDNATAVYEGNDGWRRVIGGDGLSTAVNPIDDQIVYGSSQYLNLTRSNDKAQSFNGLNVPGSGSSPFTNFAGPFVLCNSNPVVLYAGRNIVYKSTNSGQNWVATNGNQALDGNAVLVLEASKQTSNLVYATTAPVVTSQVGLFKTVNGGSIWNNVSAGVPNRYIMDIAIDPVDNNKVYLAIGGFGTPHLFRTTDGGLSWNSIGTGLPDVPANSIFIDPLNTSIIYFGNDIGIYVSVDAGNTWQPFNDGMIDGVFVMDITSSPSNRKLRIATHGKGVFERDMLPVTATGINELLPATFTIFPNPATDFINLRFEKNSTPSSVKILDGKGKTIRNYGPDFTRISIENLNGGVYYILAEINGRKSVSKFVKL